MLSNLRNHFPIPTHGTFETSRTASATRLDKITRDSRRRHPTIISTPSRPAMRSKRDKADVGLTFRGPPTKPYPGGNGEQASRHQCPDFAGRFHQQEPRHHLCCVADRKRRCSSFPHTPPRGGRAAASTVQAGGPPECATMVATSDARPAAIALGHERGRIVTSAPPTSHRPTKIRIIVAIMIAMARWSRTRNNR